MVTQRKFTLLNSVPRKVSRYVAATSGLPMDYDIHDYSEISRAINVFTIESHHKINDLNWEARIVHGRWNVSETIRKIFECNVSYNPRLSRPLQK